MRYKDKRDWVRLRAKCNQKGRAEVRDFGAASSELWCRRLNQKREFYFSSPAGLILLCPGHRLISQSGLVLAVTVARQGHIGRNET